jgi:hypothetical protein
MRGMEVAGDVYERMFFVLISGVAGMGYRAWII